MAYHFDGKAIFSTHNGEYARREKVPSIRTILRSNPIEDQQTMVAKLRHEFPEVCKAITSPVTDRDVYEYFDYCDAMVQGFEFLRAVLEYIARLNASVYAEQATNVQGYVGCWKNTNAEAFTYTRPYHSVTDLFTREDIEEYGIEFLTEAMVHIKRLKAEEDENETRQSALRLQSQHTQMMQDQRNFIQSQAPAQPPFPVTSSSAQGIRATSNPERGQSHPQGGLPRHLPAPPGQFEAPRFHLPLQRLTPSTELLEHIHPGSTSRGNFHSDPVAQDAMNSYNSGPPNSIVAVPSRGLPGPFSYPPAQAIPLLNRMGTSGGNPPKGKKNPKKKSSDDARMAAGTGNGPRQATNNTNPKQDYTPNHVQMPFHPRSTSLFQEVRPSKAVRYSSNYHPPNNVSPGHHSSNRPEWFPHLPYYRQAPVQTTREGHSSERVVSSSYSPSTLNMQGPTQDPRYSVQNLPVSTNTQHQVASASEELFEENVGSISTPVRPHNVEHQHSDHPFHAQREQDHVSDLQRAVLAPVSNASQPQYPTTSGRSGANETPRRPVLDGCKIWIGGIPNEIDRDGVTDLLRQCRGLVDFSGPKVSSPARTSRKNSSYAFASFYNPTDAAEALERLPQTRFPSLPEGTFLITDYAKPSKIYSSPSHYYGGTDGASKQPVSSVSPTKSPKDQDTNHVGKSKSEHGRKLSKGSAQGRKQPASTSEGKPEHPSKCVMDADKKDSNLQSNEAIVIPDPDGKKGTIAYERQSITDGPGPMPPNKGSGAVQSDVVDPHATQLLSSANDGTQDASSTPSANLQVQARSLMSSRDTEGRSKTSKKKPKGSNKLSVHEKRDWEPSRVHTASGNTKPKARAKPSVNGSPQSLKCSGPTGGNGNQAENENESSRVIAPIIPFKSTPTSKDLENADQTFLGREATEDDRGEPKASVACVGGGKDEKTNVSEIAPAVLQTALSSLPFEQSEELTSQVMRRNPSNSTQGSTDTTWTLVSHPGPPVNSQTERSSSISQEYTSPTIQAVGLSTETNPLTNLLGSDRLRDKLKASIVSSSASQSGSVENSKSACEEYGQPQEVRLESETSIQSLAPGETPTQENLRCPTIPSPFEMEKGAKAVEGLPTPTKGDVEAGLVEEDPEQASSMLSKQPPPSKSNRSLLKSPARKRALSIPPRSSSLASPSTPIKTHRKKKPRNLTPVTEASPTSNADLPADRMRSDLNLRTTESGKLNSTVLNIDPAARSLTTDKSRDLPKPETPFLMDDGVRVNPPKISRQVVEASTADRYYAQKNNYQVLYWSSNTQTNANFYNLDSSDSASTPPYGTNTPDTASANKQDLETTLREAGYRSLSSTSPFTIKDPDLAFFEAIDEQGKPLENRTNKDGPMLTWLDDKGKIGHLMSLDAWTKQHEMIEVVKKATAAKRLLADSPPPFWTRIESLRQKLSRFITHFTSDTNSRHNTKPKAQRVLKAEALLKRIPQRDASISEMQKWSRKVSLFVEQNASDPTSTDVETRESTTSTSPRRRQQEKRDPVLINEPEMQALAHKPGRDDDASETSVTHINDSRTSEQTTEDEHSPSTFGRRTPSDEELTPSLDLMLPTAITQVTQLEEPYINDSRIIEQTTEDKHSPSTFGRRTPSDEEVTPSLDPMPPTAIIQVTQLEEPLVTGEDRRRWSNDRHWSSNPKVGERMISADLEHESLSAESEVSRLIQIKHVDSEQESKEMENETQEDIRADKPCKSKGKELGSGEMKQDQTLTAESDKPKDPTSAELNEQAVQEAKESEVSAQRKQNPQQPQVLFSSFESNQTTSKEGNSDELQQTRPRGAHSPLKRSGYNAVAGRGIDGKRGGNKEASKDPWALPQGEKPWGCGGEGRGKRNKREG